MHELLGSPRLSLRLMALRVLSEKKAVEQLLLSPVDHPALAWALARAAEPEELRCSGREMVRLALFLRSRELRRETRGPGLERCLKGLRSATFCITAFAWAARTIELHKERAISGLMDVLRRRERRPEPAEAAAWALGKLGRAVVGELEEAFRQPSRGTRFWLFQVVWYLGPQARALSRQVAHYLPDPVAEAALLAMQEAGSLAAVEALARVQTPVWLDSGSLAALAELLYGFDTPLRVRAAHALSGFGPARSEAVALLASLVTDPEPAVREAVAVSLVEQRAPARLLLPQVLDQVPEVASFARHYCEVQGDPETLILEELLHGTPERQRCAVSLLSPSVLRRLPLESWLSALKSPEPAVRLALAGRLAQEPGAWPALRPLLSDPDPEVRRRAANALSEDPDPETLALLRGLLDDPDPVVFMAPVRALSHRGTPEDIARIFSDPHPVVLSWVADVLRQLKTMPAALLAGVRSGLVQHPSILEVAAELTDDLPEEALVRLIWFGRGREGALRAWSKKASQDKLLKLLTHEDEEVRFQVASWLESILNRRPDYADGLLWLGESSPRVRQALESCLRHMAGDEKLPEWLACAGPIGVGAAMRALARHWDEVGPTPAALLAVAAAVDRLGSEVQEALEHLLAHLPPWPLPIEPNSAVSHLPAHLWPAVRHWLTHSEASLRREGLRLARLLWTNGPGEEMLLAVVPALEDAEAEVREAAARCLAGAPARAAAALRERLDDPAPQVRLRVLGSLAALGDFPSIEAFWLDPDPNVRSTVTGLLLHYGHLPANLVDSLRAGREVTRESLLLAHSLLSTVEERELLASAFIHSSSESREVLVETVAGYGVIGLEALDLVQEDAALSLEVRRAAEASLARLARRTPGGLRWLLAERRQRSPALDDAAIWLLEAAGTSRLQELAGELEGLTENRNEELAAAAARALRRLGRLEAGLDSPLALVPRSALRALTELSLDQIELGLRRKLAELADGDPDEEVRELAREGLLQIDHKILEHALNSGDDLAALRPLIPPEHVESLWKQTPLRRLLPDLIQDVTTQVELMARGLQDPDREVRLAFARRLSRAGSFLPEVIPVLLEQSDHDLSGLLTTLGEAALPPLRDALEHSDPVIRERACRAVGLARDQAARPRLEELARTDPVGGVRLAASDALERIRP
ncbi:MAG: hypothetical protein AMXMBFR33_55830 [Candidatus Xenobia bacterium]